MTTLLQSVIEAHGGMERWSQIRSVDLKLNFSGMALEMLGLPRHLQPRCAIDVTNACVTIEGIGTDTDLQWVFTPDRVWCERRDGGIVAVLDAPREALKARMQQGLAWEPIHFAYFLGYAIRNYLTVPFIFAEPGMEHRELEAHVENGETWRVLEVAYPEAAAVHTRVQKLYFGPDYLLRRLDYTVDVLGGGPAAHYCYDYRAFDGIMIPTLRRVVSPVNVGPFIAGATTIFLLDYIDVALIRA